MNYEQMGIAAMIPGMQHMIDLMQRELDSMREQLAQAQNGGNARSFLNERKRGRPPKLIEGSFRVDGESAAAKEFSRKSRASSSFWAKMSAEERSAEMRRRGMVRKDSRKAKLSADKASSSSRKGYWASMSPEERKAEMRRRIEVRDKKWAEEAALEKLHPRDPRSPKHAAWIEKMRAANKANWAKLSPKERAVRVAATRKPQHVNGEAVA